VNPSLGRLHYRWERLRDKRWTSSTRERSRETTTCRPSTALLRAAWNARGRRMSSLFFVAQTMAASGGRGKGSWGVGRGCTGRPGIGTLVGVAGVCGGVHGRRSRPDPAGEAVR